MTESFGHEKAFVLDMLRKGCQDMKDPNYVPHNNTLWWIQRLHGFMAELKVSYEELGITEDRIKEVEKMAINFEIRLMVGTLQKPELNANVSDLVALAALIKEHGLTAKDFDMDEEEWRLLSEKFDSLPQGITGKPDSGN